MSQSANLDTALQLAREGFSVFPCRPDKKPYTRHGVYDATTDEAAIRAWWEAWPDAIPALPCGANSLFIVDCDRKPGAPDGVANFIAACAASGIDLTGCFVVQTPSTGLHYYFRVEAGCQLGNTVAKLGLGIDTRGVGGYVVAPGAILPDGRAYLPMQGAPWATPRVPEAIQRHLATDRAAPEPAVSVNPSSATDADRDYALAALKDEFDKLCAVTSSRNTALNVAAHSLGTLVGNGSLSETEAVNALIEAATINGYIAKDGKAEAMNTIYSGMTSGKKKPRSLQSQSAVAIHAESLRKPKTTSKPKRSIVLVQGSEIVERPITWLWNGYLPLGKLTLLAGASGAGKSTLAFSIAATITTGGLWPDGKHCEAAGNVLIWSSEDDPADVIKPRLMAMGANHARYGIIKAVTTEQDGEMPFDPARDMDDLRDAAKQIGGVSLLIIDPIVSAVSGDMHKANDVRRSLQPVVDFAAEMKCAVIGITHFAKNTAGRNTAERTIGSQAFGALPRMNLVAVKDKETDNRVFTRAQSNISPEGGGFNYTIQQVLLHRGIVTTRIVWGTPVEGNAQSIIDDAEGVERESKPVNKVGEAETFLHEELKNGPRPAREMIEKARQLAITERSLQRAREKRGILTNKAGKEDGWVWHYPFNL